MLLRYIVLLLLLAGYTHLPAQQPNLHIFPARPQRGGQVTITWQPPDTVAAAALAQQGVTLVFSYSNLYELPLNIQLQQENQNWVTRFTIPKYGVFATFYIKSGERIFKPAPDRHYELAVYAHDSVPVKNGLLYKAYSLGAQMGKAPALKEMQAALYKKELALYPGNYEAKVRLAQYEASTAPQEKQAALLQKANAIIAQKFEEDPGHMANLNYVTMGYLILGENSRLDSIRQVVMQRYPASPAAKELVTGEINKEKDTTLKIARLEKELQTETPAEEEAYQGMHEILFDYYVAVGNAAKALYHARKTISPNSPYLPQTLLDISRTLSTQKLAPDSALAYAQRSLALANQFPAGLIRYFPETGYIPSYVDDSTRQAVHRKAKSNILALMGRIYADKNEAAQAVQYTDSATALAAQEQTLRDAAYSYEQLHQYGKAFGLYQQLVLQLNREDSSAFTALHRNYVSWKGSDQGWATQLQAIETEKKEKLLAVLRKQQLRQQAPSLQGIVNLQGQPVPPDSLRNKIILIDFWATWCVPCMQEMPYLQKVYDVYKNDPRIAFMIINSGARNTLTDAQNWFGNKKYSFPVYFHTNPAVGDVFGFNVIPATYIIDRKGLLQFKSIGFEGPGVEEKLKNEIALLLKEE